MKIAMAALVALTLMSTAANAAEIRVPVKGLDLRDAAHAETFYRRAKAEARRVCNAESILVQTSARLLRTCVAELTDAIVAKVDSPALSAVAQSKRMATTLVSR
jgi:UrcA family protein